MQKITEHCDDYASADGAALLAAELREYWRQRGYEIRTRITYSPAKHGGKGRYDVASDLRNGLPQGHPLNKVLSP
jgi:hypothetical protein